MAYDAQAPERSAFTMPREERGSKIDPASPTASQLSPATGSS
jgi:hypothetical protein